MTAPRPTAAHRICGGFAAAALLLALGGPGAAPNALAQPARADFREEATLACLKAAGPGRGVLDCVGRSANACMEATPGGDTTLGMTACLEAERLWWDARLNRAYGVRMKAAREADAEPPLRGPPSGQAAALRTMQRAWIAWRDAACAYERSTWQGGSGALPATTACHMHETARQTLVLEGRWEN